MEGGTGEEATRGEEWRVEERENRESVAILAQAISCSNVRMVFLRYELFWFPSAFMANTRQIDDDAEHTVVPGSPLQDLSSNIGSPDGSVTDLERVGARPASAMEEKFEAFAKKVDQFDLYLKSLAPIPMLVQGFTRFENSILSLTQSLATITNNIASVEQVVGGLAARVAALEAGAVSASSVSGSAGS